MQTTEVYDHRRDLSKTVPAPTLSYSQFADLARQAWRTTRSRLWLQFVEPEFQFTESYRHALGSAIGDRSLLLTDVIAVRIVNEADAEREVWAFGDQLMAAQPAAFGRDQLLSASYYGVRLVTDVDDFSIRVSHLYDWDRDHWFTHLSALIAKEPTPARAKQIVMPACPTCGRAVLFSRSLPEGRTPSDAEPVECGGCGWRGVSPRVV